MSMIRDPYEKLTSSLAVRQIESFKTALKFFGATVAVTAVVGSGLAFLSLFSPAVFGILTVVSVLSLPVGFFVLEGERLIAVRDAAKEVLAQSKNYELILQEARKERDEAIATIGDLRTEFFLQARLEERLRSLLPDHEPQPELEEDPPPETNRKKTKGK